MNVIYILLPFITKNIYSISCAAIEVETLVVVIYCKVDKEIFYDISRVVLNAVVCCFFDDTTTPVVILKNLFIINNSSWQITNCFISMHPVHLCCMFRRLYNSTLHGRDTVIDKSACMIAIAINFRSRMSQKGILLFCKCRDRRLSSSKMFFLQMSNFFIVLISSYTFTVTLPSALEHGTATVLEVCVCYMCNI